MKKRDFCERCGSLLPERGYWRHVCCDYEDSVMSVYEAMGDYRFHYHLPRLVFDASTTNEEFYERSLGRYLRHLD